MAGIMQRVGVVCAFPVPARKQRFILPLIRNTTRIGSLSLPATGKYMGHSRSAGRIWWSPSAMAGPGVEITVPGSRFNHPAKISTP